MDQKSLKSGVLLIALGHKNYYKMAYALAASIRVNDGLPVCIVTDIPIEAAYSHLFDICIIAGKEIYEVNGKNEWIKAKLHMYDLSPFDETLFLDVDQIMIKGRSLKAVMKSLENIDFSISNTGKAKVSVWVDIQEALSVYGMGREFWNYHSEFVYFRKSDTVAAYFNAAIKVYEENKLASATRFAGATMADELAFQIASLITGMYPHRENWTPNFWYERTPELATKHPYELKSYVTYSIGGKSLPKRIKENYNTLAKHYFASLGLSNSYQVVDKRNFLPERQII